MPDGARRNVADWRSLATATAAVALVRLLLWAIPYRTLAGRIGDAGRDRTLPPPPPVGAVERIAADVERAARLVPGATCLVQALAGAWLIGRAGAPVGLEFGVARGARGVEAHAWLVSGGRVILGGREAARFTRLGRTIPR